MISPPQVFGRIPFLILICSICSASLLSAQSVVGARVFYQDEASQTLKWTDLFIDGTPRFGAVREITGFPKIDPNRQSLIGLQLAGGKILVGVRDREQGKIGSGWILIDSGVVEEPHGNHSHWYYERNPSVIVAMIDDQQGNPVRVESVQQVFYIILEEKNGFIRLDPAAITPDLDRSGLAERAAFHKGGSGKGAISIVGNRVGYVSFPDTEGDQAGRVDVVTLYLSGNPQQPPFLKLPRGGIGSSAAVQNKVFFTVSDGVCWMDVPSAPPVDPTKLMPQHISLAGVVSSPLTLGEFSTFNNYITCISTQDSRAAVWVFDASRPQPHPVKLNLPGVRGNPLSRLHAVMRRTGLPLGFVFHGPNTESTAAPRLSIIDLDPNADDSWEDAKPAQDLILSTTPETTDSKGQAGFSIDFDADRRRAIFSSPAARTLNILPLDNLKSPAAFTVEGRPTGVLVIGGRGGGHH